jgi:DNA-binding transcriptional ArsR family regulator
MPSNVIVAGYFAVRHREVEIDPKELELHLASMVMSRAGSFASSWVSFCGLVALRSMPISCMAARTWDNTRLRILNLIGDQEICVCYFVEILGGPQPKISRHLAYLRSAGIVAGRREGKWMHYRIVIPPHIGAAQILRHTLGWLKEEKAMLAGWRPLGLRGDSGGVEPHHAGMAWAAIRCPLRVCATRPELPPLPHAALIT